MSIGTGWLARNDALPEENHGVFIPAFSGIEQAPFPTRRCEYWFAASALEEQIRGLVVDAGCGFNPEIHKLPEILARMGYEVYAIDANPAVLDMPLVPHVVRNCGTMAHLSCAPDSVDHWVCISVLEHLEPSLRMATIQEAHRTLKRGGLMVLTLDETEPDQLTSMLVECGFEVGPCYPLVGDPLQPPVSWAIGRKP